MFKLLEGIKVIDYDSHSLSSNPRMWINSGTIQAVKSQSFDARYSNRAFIPIESWRELEKYEEELLYVNSNDVSSSTNRNTYIGIIPLPEQVLTPFENLGVNFAKNPQDCQTLLSESAYKQAVDNIVEYLQSLCLSDRKLIVHSIATNPSSLNTVTYNQVEKCFIGLHLDSWDKLPLEKRHLATNRICINFGLEDRFFLFINLTLIDILHLLNVNKIDDGPGFYWENRQERLINYYSAKSPHLLTRIPDSIRQMFLTRYSKYPVFIQKESQLLNLKEFIG